jgi:MFS family permease
MAAVKPGLRIHGWFAVIWLIYLIDWADRFAVSAVLPAIQQEFSLSDAQLGLMSGSLFLGLAVLAVPCGLAVDRFSRKYMITLMTLVWSAATWSTGLARSYVDLVLARILVGAGEAGYNPAGYALIAAWYPERLRGTMVGLFHMAQPLGVGVGVIAAGYLATEYGWRAVFGVLAAPGILLALLMLFAPDYRTRSVVPGRSDIIRPGLLDALRFIADNRTLQLIYLAQLPITLYIMSIAMWGPTFLGRQYQLSLAESAAAVGVITMLAGFGALFGGILSDRLARGNPRARVTVCVAYLLVPLVLHSVTFIGSIHGLPLASAILLFGIGQFFAAANWGTLVAAGMDQSPPQYRATVQSFLPLFQAIAALAAGMVSGMLSDRFGLTLALEGLLVGGIVSGIFLLLLARSRYNLDHARQQSLDQFEIELD